MFQSRSDYRTHHRAGPACLGEYPAPSWQVDGPRARCGKMRMHSTSHSKALEVQAHRGMNANVYSANEQLSRRTQFSSRIGIANRQTMRRRSARQQHPVTYHKLTLATLSQDDLLLVAAQLPLQSVPALASVCRALFTAMKAAGAQEVADVWSVWSGMTEYDWTLAPGLTPRFGLDVNLSCLTPGARVTWTRHYLTSDPSCFNLCQNVTEGWCCQTST